ncbi:hypothetical protein [Xenorhabdus bovienii]|uniref:hypothetical protein n=1 Tax=Xenorhabdus bovienii TaxID=40576 RepID=UPI0023B27FD1|nr:hypothetical protein [Xenorhabdus bovienii]MDE9441389.1 hypothetical protein [Xenorhabdus bovienii]MDE9457619.1 hypothetical protein [Xenorhabdus bovienii]MDE9514496.1 hypothetical protein [Xenorhabdus bovienii]
MELTELNNKLSNLVPMSDFKLDNRTSLQLLKYIEAYTKIIPFENSDKYWNDFFFMANNTPEKLAELYQGKIAANGKLLPHQAFLLAVLRLLETPISLLNTLPAAHRELYYRALLGLSPRSAQPDQVALSVELNPTVTEQLLTKGTLFEAGQDEQGNALQYALDASLLANRGYISDLCWLRKKEKQKWMTAAPMDLQAQVSLPSDGIRLFSETQHDKPVVGGVLIVSAHLALEKGVRTIIVTFDKDIDAKDLEAQISSGNQWLTLTSKVDKKEVTLTLADKEPASSAPEDLYNFVFTQPVLRLQRKDRQALPAVKSFMGKENTKDSASFETYYLTPFGYSSEIEPLEENPALYLGITDVEPGQTLSLYWKLKSPQQPEKVSWYYLNQCNQWAVLDAWVNDQTQHLYQDGTWQVVLPADASSQATQMPTGRYWLKAIPKHKDPWEKNPWPYGLSYSEILHNKKVPVGVLITSAHLVLEKETGQITVTFDKEIDTQDLVAQISSSNQWLTLTSKVDKKEVTLTLADKEPASSAPEDLDNLVFTQPVLWLQRKDSQAFPAVTNLKVQENVVNSKSFEVYHLPKYKDPWLYSLSYNAMTATLANADSISDSHFLNPLPSGSIQRPVEPIMALASVNQPWASWNGRVPESHNAFFERGAQHLSHRNRALTWGNMATLLKEHYVSIFDVKYPSNDELTRVPALAEQQLTIIPANRYNDSDDPLRPVLNEARRTGMAKWLQQKGSPWAEIKISNPQYVDVNINYKVKFKPGVNDDFGYRQLRQQLSKAYMPWSVDEQRPVMLNNSINYYQLLATIQQQPLVERVICLTLKRKKVTKESSNTASVKAKDNEVLILVWGADDKLQCRGNNDE